MSSSVYLDHAASTPVDSRVLDVMLPHLSAVRGNPSSLHGFGATARAAIDAARENVARLIGADPEEIYFTSGGTESDNLALFGLTGALDGRHVVVSAIEHAAVREPMRRFGMLGYEVTRVGVDGYGRVDPADVETALRPDTALVAVMWANNEVGTVQPVPEIAELCAERGIPFHVDAVQAAGHLPVDVRRVPVSTLALSSHKLYGPQGVGALYMRRGVGIEAQVLGGGQEQGLRSGTENAAGIAGFGEAARLALEEMEERARRETDLRDRIIAGAAAIDGIRLNGHPVERLPNNIHLTVSGVESESLVLFLDALGYAVSSGSACASHGVEHKASPVLLAMGQERDEAFSAIRITVGKDTKPEEAEGFLEALSAAVRQLRQMSPLQAS